MDTPESEAPAGGARLRVLELPTEHQGEYMRTPFVLVLDRLSAEEGAVLTQEQMQAMQDGTGAETVLAFGFPVELER